MINVNPPTPKGGVTIGKGQRNEKLKMKNREMKKWKT
jgi:hypothetical protein